MHLWCMFLKQLRLFTFDLRFLMKTKWLHLLGTWPSASARIENFPEVTLESMLATYYAQESSRGSSKTRPSKHRRQRPKSRTVIEGDSQDSVIRFSSKQFMKQLRCDVRNGVLAPKLSIAIRYIAFRTRVVKENCSLTVLLSFWVFPRTIDMLATLVVVPACVLACSGDYLVTIGIKSLPSLADVLNSYMLLQ